MVPILSAQNVSKHFRGFAEPLDCHIRGGERTHRPRRCMLGKCVCTLSQLNDTLQILSASIRIRHHDSPEDRQRLGSVR